ncbi:MAG: hypothetical protein RJQ01_02810 [Microcella sp.]|uniref:hypothetical protein n=1 Tax=Microcella sp. TaxID=1913979 RepID=UPI003315C90E
MTTMSIPTAGYGRPRSPRRIPIVRRLVLATGLALVSWSRRSVRRRSHEEQARSIRTETLRLQAAAPFRYGITQ